jgi:signal transduction histidine kinase
MLYELGLFCAVAVGLLVTVDALGGVRRSVGMADLLALGVTLVLWAAGELVIQFARDGSEILLGRRLLYAGACFLPVVWLWLAARATGAGWVRHHQWALVVAALPAALFYSCLYWDTKGRFIDWTEIQPVVGPWFWCFASYGWALILLGTCYFVALATRHGAARPLRAAAILIGALTPLLANIVHLTSGFEGHDLTPVFIALGAPLLRFAIIDAGLAGFLPRARRDVIEQLDSGVLVSNLHGIVVDANPAAARLLQADHLVGRSLQSVLEGAPDDPSGAIEIREFSVRGLLGEVGRCVLLTDRSETRRIEQQLLLAQRLESIGTLTAGIAHEVNNPLAFVRGNLSNLERIAKVLSQEEAWRALPPELHEAAAEAPEIVAELQDGVNRISRIVANLKSFGRPEQGKELGPVRLADVAERAATMAGVALTTGTIQKRYEDTPPVVANLGELVQVAVNLLVNAIQATAGETPIDLEVAPARGGACLRVRDRGPGIPSEVLPHVFDPFFTTKPPGKGTGLGLSLSFDLVRRLGGTLDASSGADGGACFELWLPAAPDESLPLEP